MSEITLTKEQQDAIFQSGKVIVSASAGSGKTFVMIRRLENALKEDLEMQDFLAVTFTNKAAESMKEKLSSALISALAEAKDEETKKKLRKKLSELPLADISTIHSFCSRLLKRFFYETPVGDAFEISAKEDARGKKIFAEAMADLISEAYREPDENFLLLLKVFRSRRGTEKLEEAIERTYFKLREDYRYRERLSSRGGYSSEGYEEAKNSLLSSWKERALLLRERLNAFEEKLPIAPPDCQEAFLDTAAALKEIENLSDIFAAPLLPDASFPSKKTAKKGFTAEQLSFRDEMDFLKKGVKDFYEELKSLSLESDEKEREKYLETGIIVSALYEYVEKFDEIYSAKKLKKSLLDYSDLEHYALELLQKDEVLSAVKNRYKMIFVDEYQDVNPTQEKILSLISGEEVFLVGDKKQAIYGFRGGKSRYFSEKEQEFAGGNLLLSSNFRSSKRVLEFVNEVFGETMTSATAGIDYAAAPMQGGERYGQAEGFVKLHILKKESKSSGESEKPKEIYQIEKEGGSLPDYATPQAQKVYSILRASVNEPSADSGGEGEDYFRFFDIDKGEFSRVRYGDIAILVREQTGEVRKLIYYLTEKGIPVTSFAETNVCDYAEIRQIIGILQAIENPENDVALTIALLSPLGKLNEGDLAAIRLFGNSQGEEGMKKSFRALVKEYAESKQDSLAVKIKDFYEVLSSLKMKSHFHSAEEIIGELLSFYGLEEEILSLPESEARMARVNRFLEECGEDSLHLFLNKLQTLGYQINYTESGGENSVKILTMHASKGLEYPVVILPFLEDTFHSFSKEEVLYPDGGGVALKHYDFEKMKKSKTVYRLAVEEKLKREQIKEELNVFYVALTRAKYALHLVWEEPKAKRFFSCPSDFISKRTERKYFVELPFALDEGTRESFSLVPCEEELAALKKVYEKPYLYAGSVSLAVKSSATSLMKTLFAQQEYYPTEKPFEERGESISTEVGLAYHAFLEHARFGEKGEYERMKGVLSEQEFALLDKEKCERILSLPIFGRLKDATLLREQKFLVTFPANEYRSDVDSTDEVLYQGAIDLLAITKEGVLLVDYKFSGKSAERLKEHYAPQLKLYRDAAAKLLSLEKSTIRTVLLNLFREEEIFVEL